MADSLADVSANQKTDYPRTRSRKESFNINREEIANRIEQFFKDFSQGRDTDLQRRIQRYAKYRGWTSGEGMWDEASDVSLPDMQSGSLRVKDTLHNAVISSRPIIQPKAVNEKVDSKKENLVRDLIDTQIFVEQPGEDFIGEAAEAFVDDGVVTVFVPWVKERRQVADVKIYPPIPDEVLPVEYFETILKQVYPQYQCEVMEGGWDWKCTDLAGEEEPVKASFYTQENGKVEVIFTQDKVVFDGPKPIVKDYEDVLYPNRCANLQIPGPSNPGGAAQVILVDYPTIDEIIRLRRSGFYDLMTKKDEDKLLGTTTTKDPATEKVKSAVDDFQGEGGEQARDFRSNEINKTVTRLLVFDIHDINNDGVGEDVMWWMILEEKMLLKGKLLVEMYPPIPGTRPRRPIAGRSFIPVKSRYAGISLLEQMEGLHDVMKMLVDFGMDSGTLSTSPFFFYRASGSVKPEVIRLAPGEGYPVGNPQQDVFFPNVQNNAVGMMLNLVTLFEQWQQKNTMVGELQYGRVPTGKASALRTTAGIQQVMGQGEARPERILRRFFMMLVEVWEICHMLNTQFLPEKKKFRTVGYRDAGNVYNVESPDEIAGFYQFDFKASIFNTNKMILQQALDRMLGTVISPLTIQLGILQPEGFYDLLVDWAQAYGQDATKYLTPPTPTAGQNKLMAEEVISFILANELPVGVPEEPIEQHIQKLLAFMQDDKFGLLSPTQVILFRAYMQQVTQLYKQQQAMMAQAQAAGQFQQSQGGGSSGGAPMQPDQGTMVSGPNELLDESLPGAGGGANAE